MHPTKVLLITINFTLTVGSILTIVEGIDTTDRFPYKLITLARASRTLYYSRIFIAVGTFQLATSMFGFWSIDSENRAGLHSYVVMTLLMIVLEGAVVLEDLFNRSSKEATLKEEFIHQTQTGLDNIQSFLHCCEATGGIDDPTFITDSCCPADYVFQGGRCSYGLFIFPVTCTINVPKYFEPRMKTHWRSLLRLAFTQVGAVIFADLFSRHLLYMQILMESFEAM